MALVADTVAAGTAALRALAPCVERMERLRSGSGRRRRSRLTGVSRPETPDLRFERHQWRAIVSICSPPQAGCPQWSRASRTKPACTASVKALRNVLHLHGLPLTEAMVVGLGSEPGLALDPYIQRAIRANVPELLAPPAGACAGSTQTFCRRPGTGRRARRSLGKSARPPLLSTAPWSCWLRFEAPHGVSHRQPDGRNPDSQ